MSFEQLVDNYRGSNPSGGVRPPDIRDVVKRAHRHRRRQVTGGVLSAALVVSAGTLAAGSLAHKAGTITPPAPIAAPALVLVASDLVGTEPHFVGDTLVDLPVSYGVAGTDALWLVGKKGANGWQLMKIGAPDVRVTVRVTVPSEPIGLAATARYVWVAVNGSDGPQLLQYGADGSAIHTYRLGAPPINVHGVNKNGAAWVTESVDGGLQVVSFDGDKQTQGATSAVIPGTPGQPATVMGGDKIFVHTRVGNDTRVSAISSKTLTSLPWSLDFGASEVRDIAFTDPLYFAASDGPQQGFWEAPLVKSTTFPAATARQISTLPTYKVSTTDAHAWALSTGTDGTVLSRFDRATGTIGASIPTDVAADKVSVMVVDKNYIWLVAGDKISVFGPS